MPIWYFFTNTKKRSKFTKKFQERCFCYLNNLYFGFSKKKSVEFFSDFSHGIALLSFGVNVWRSSLVHEYEGLKADIYFQYNFLWQIPFLPQEPLSYHWCFALLSVVYLVQTVYGWFHPGRRMTPKNGTFFFYGATYISLNMNIDGIQPTFMYPLRVSRGPHDLCLGLSLVELV